MKILFQGDSITDAGRYTEVGTGVRDSSLGAGYVKLIANRLLCDSPEKNYEIINRGISGNRIVDLYARWKADCINLAPDVLTILIGVNDTWHERGGQNGVEVPRYERFYRELIEWTLSALPNIKIILMTPFANPVNDHIASFFPEVNERQEVVEKLAKEFSLPCVKLHEDFEAANARAPMEYWTPDGVHPSGAGHQMIADAWLKAFAQL
jgi:lysophospholipase L1-like esterase